MFTTDVITNQEGWIKKFQDWLKNKKTKSFCGQFATVKDMAVLIKELDDFISEKNISSLVDIGCGDVHWIKELKEFMNINFLGIDFIPDLIFTLNVVFSNNKNINFENVDILTTPLKQYINKPDLIIVHNTFTLMTFYEILIALDNILSSNPKYIMITSYDERQNDLRKIDSRNWKPMNLEDEPFNFNSLEKLYEKNEIYSDKCLCVFKGRNLKSMIKRRLKKYFNE